MNLPPGLRRPLLSNNPSPSFEFRSCLNTLRIPAPANSTYSKLKESELKNVGNRIMRTLGRKSSEQWRKISYEGECNNNVHIVSNCYKSLVSNKLARKCSHAEAKCKKNAELSNLHQVKCKSFIALKVQLKKFD